LNCRIKYEQDKKNPHILRSKHEVISKRGSRYRVILNLQEMTYVIRNVKKRRNYTCSVKITNLNVLKRKVKAHLTKLGCKFSMEIRNRTFGICEKGYSQQKHLNKIKQTIPAITQDGNLE